MEQLVEAERSVLWSWPERALRIDLGSLITRCGGLGWSDHPVDLVLDLFVEVDALLADESQTRTGSDFETRCLGVVDELRPIVQPVLAKPRSALTLDDRDAIQPILVDVPLRGILGSTEMPDRLFDLISWNEASTLDEGMNRPYFAARRIVRQSIFRPQDRFRLLDPLESLVVRYEDEPDVRDETAAEIVALLDDFRARAPWPVTG